MRSELVKSVVAGVPLPLILIAADERIAAANAAAEALYGNAIVGRHHITVMRAPSLLDAIEGTQRLGQPGKARITVSLPGGRETTWRVLTAPLADGGVLVSFEDTTDLEHAGQMRRDFVANVSHELRTPLTALLGFIETLKGAARDDPAARARFLTIMEREAGRMNRLVSDLLSLSRVEAEERVRPSSRIDIAQRVASAVNTLRPMAEAVGVAIEIDDPEGGPAEVLADADQMAQVFTNLIENAVKYGAGGGVVTVKIRREARNTGLRGPAVRIEVIDRGEGIDAVHIPRLTERFYRVDSHRSREQGGTGLGLAIVKHIVNRHRGRFRIDSTLGEGSRFTVLLPAA
ncbi:sensor histidine kinase [Acidimangrovimonas sediminis]|uniref:sensor histidine kinase n=1 Tax=Acidimangrovimonas sediminis TaxID=2056283 RepID=UPI000C8024DB|nr:ATP-binding protein [Acidimangrovimonas sediminis]